MKIEVPQLLQMARESMEMSQAEFARLLGCNRTQVSRAETGRDVSEELARKIDQQLGAQFAGLQYDNIIKWINDRRSVRLTASLQKRGLLALPGQPSEGLSALSLTRAGQKPLELKGDTTETIPLSIKDQKSAEEVNARLEEFGTALKDAQEALQRATAAYGTLKQLLRLSNEGEEGTVRLLARVSRHIPNQWDLVQLDGTEHLMLPPEIALFSYGARQQAVMFSLQRFTSMNQSGSYEPQLEVSPAPVQNPLTLYVRFADGSERTMMIPVPRRRMPKAHSRRQELKPVASTAFGDADWSIYMRFEHKIESTADETQ